MHPKLVQLVSITFLEYCLLGCSMVIHPDQKCQDQVTIICTCAIDTTSGAKVLPRADAPPPAKGITEIFKRQVAKFVHYNF